MTMPGSGVRAVRIAKSLRLAALFGHAAWLVAVRFPRWQQQQRLDAIQRWAQQVLAVLEIEVQSQPLPRAGFAGLVVSNHLSWLDILVVQSLMPACFVAKTEVRRWPVVGYLAQACATIFVNRASPRSARAMVDDTAAAIAQGYAVVVFPEGTSSDGQTLGHFHANIFESAIRAGAGVQLLTLRYRDRATGATAHRAHFIGDMTLASSLHSVMASSTIQACVHWGDCLVSAGHSRKSLAQLSHQKICAQLMQGALHLPVTPST
jgi:1-acyl-sn-glycerol-3-phosphate acyltransferase